MASFASLGDLIIAEPKCMVGFRRPKGDSRDHSSRSSGGFQTAEFLRDHGFIDLIVRRPELRQTLAQLLGYLSETNLSRVTICQDVGRHLEVALRYPEPGIKLGLDAIHALTDALGNPHQRSGLFTSPAPMARARFAPCWNQSLGRRD